MAKNNKTRFFYVLYSDKTRIFDQSERAYYPIYIIMINNLQLYCAMIILLSILQHLITTLLSLFLALTLHNNNEVFHGKQFTETTTLN